MIEINVNFLIGFMEKEPDFDCIMIKFEYTGEHETCQGGKKRRLNQHERSKFAKKNG